MPDKRHFIFYGNSSMTIGAGHIMRLFALAQYAQSQGFKVTFLYKECLQALIEKLQGEDFATHKIASPLASEYIMSLAPTHVVIDDYSLSIHEWSLLSHLPVFKIVLDDALNQEPLCADLVVNASSCASIADYQKRAPKAKLCLGPSFTILRREFIEASAKIPVFKSREHVLITMGGTDVKKLSPSICEHLLSTYPHLKLSVLSGTAAPELEALTCKYEQLKLYVNTSHVAEIMAQAGLAISAAGGTMGELACMRTPTIALICADNQLPVLHSSLNGTWYTAMDFRDYSAQSGLSKISAIGALANEFFQDYEKRLMMQQLAGDAVDGKGCQRILECVLHHG